MPKIPLTPPFRGSDDLAPSQGGVELIDGYMDQVSQADFALFRRGGLWPFWWSGLQDPIDGLFWWQEKLKLIVVCGGRVFVMSNMTDAPTEITSATCTLNSLKSASFASSGSWLFITTKGSLPIIWNGSGLAEYLTGAPYVDSLAFLNGYVLMNESGTNVVHFALSVVGSTDKPTYQVGITKKPDGNPDNLVALSSRFGELMVSGTSSTEIWFFDPTIEYPLFPFRSMAGAPSEHGVSSADTVTFFDNAFVWLNNNKQVVKMAGGSRNPEVVSSSFDRTLKAMTTINDAKGFMVDNRFYCLSFPTDDFCLVYDFINQGWYKWSYWDGSKYQRFLGNCAVWVPEWNTQFVGSRVDGRLMVYSKALVTDLFGPIRMSYKTAHLDWGTLEVKQSDKLMLRLRRGV